MHALIECEHVATDLGLAVHDDHKEGLAARLGLADHIDMTVGDGVAADGHHSSLERERGHFASQGFEFTRSGA